MNANAHPKPKIGLSPKARLWRKSLLYLVGFFAFVFVVGAIAGYIGYQDGHREATTGIETDAFASTQPNVMFWLLVGGGTVGGLLGMLWSKNYWDAIDEAAQRAHLEGWFWGGSIALALGAPLVVALILMPNLELPEIEVLAVSKTNAAAIGAAMLYSIMIIGYGLTWLFWWWKRR